MTLKLNNFESLLDDLSLVSLPIISYSCSKNNLFLTIGFQYLSSLLRNFIFNCKQVQSFIESYFNLPSFKVICFGHLFTKFTSLTSHLYCLSACILCVSFQNFKFKVNCFAVYKSLYHYRQNSIPSFHFCPTFTDVIFYSGCAVIHCLLLKVLLPPSVGLYMLDLPVILEIAFL